MKSPYSADPEKIEAWIDRLSENLKKEMGKQPVHKAVIIYNEGGE